jgi:hypothetical protein
MTQKFKITGNPDRQEADNASAALADNRDYFSGARVALWGASPA